MPGSESDVPEAVPEVASEMPPAISWRHRDHTRGSLFISLLVLALPQFISSAAGSVTFQLADLTFLSRLGEAQLTAVVIVNQTLRQVVMMLMMGVAFGTQALISRAVGEGNGGRAEAIAGQALVLAGLLAICVGLTGWFFAEALFQLPGPDPAFVPYGVPYLRLVYLLNFGLMGSMIFNAVLWGAGDTTTPLFVHLVQSAIAILAEWVLMFGNLGAPALGVEGTALGIACGQIVAMSIGLTVLFRGGSRVHLRTRNLRPDPKLLKQILALSWPPAFQMIGGVLMTLTFIRLAGGFGEHVQAAYAIGLRLGFVVPMVCFPIATSCATLVGQALGAGDVARAWRSIGASLVVHGSLMLSFAVFTFFFRSEIIATFSDDPEVIAVGADYLLYTSLGFACWAFQFVFMRALQGAGDMLVPMVIGISAALFTIPLAIGLANHTDLGPSGIWIAQLANSVVTTVAFSLRIASRRWTEKRL